MKFARVYSINSKNEVQPYGGVKFVKRDSVIRSAGGGIVFEMRGLLAPEQWSQTAVDILAQKYFRKAGVPAHRIKTANDSEPLPPEWLRCSVRDPQSKALDTGETDARQVFDRIAGAWTYHAWKGGYFGPDKLASDLKTDEREERARVFYDEIRAMLALQVFAPNSPQWFNTGLHWAYGIETQGSELFRVDPARGIASAGDAEAVAGSYRHPMSYACFIQGVEDKLTGPRSILDLAAREALVFKYGGGSGSNFSKVRGENEPLTAGGKSSGLMSFLKGIDAFAGAIKSGGTTRRAAKMCILNDDHPDIFDFATWKVREEDKAAMIAAGSELLRKHTSAINLAAEAGGTDPAKNSELARAAKAAIGDGVPKPFVRRVLAALRDGVPIVPNAPIGVDWQSSAFQTVAGQNSNNTIRVRNKFLTAATTGGTHSLFWRTELEKAKRENREPKPCRTIQAADLWRAITRAAWHSADPGLNFADTINEWDTCPEDEEIDATNPCSEYIWKPNTGCNLASLNLVAFIERDANGNQVFNFEKLKHAARLVTVALDVTVSMSAYPSAEIAAGAHNYRTLGLGYANLGGLLMRFGVGYDTDKGRGICAAVTCLMHSTSVATGAELAKELGAFPRYEKNRKGFLRVMRNHAILSGYGSAVGANLEGVTREHYRLNAKEVDPQFRDTAAEAVRAAASAYELCERFGCRNAQSTNLAPTGTIGLIMDCDTTGIEPDFALVKVKTLAGGGYFKIVNQSVPVALAAMGFSSDTIKNTVAYIAGRNTFADCPHRDKIGLTAAQADELAQQLPSCFDLRYLNHEAYPDGIPWEKWLTASELEDVTRYVLGTGTVEGCPFLPETYWPVFDCANRCGTGTRSLPWDSHVRMMSAAQSWISGGISKTINLPSSATVEEIARAYLLAWRLGIKCVAVYRDGSKLSQPLTSAEDEFLAYADSQPTTVQAAAAKIVYEAAKSGRVKLPSRRKGYTQKVRVGSNKLYLRTGEYPDGTLGEIFVDLHKEGAAFRSLMNCFCIAVSLGLQRGVPLADFVDKFTFQRFEPNGPVTEHDRIKNATSIIDFVFRDLAINYLDRDDLAHVPAPDMPDSLVGSEQDRDERADATAAEAAAVEAPKPKTREEAARASGYSGNFCPRCNSARMKRTGSCECCEACGETTGCT